MADKVFTTRNFEAERRAIPLPIQTYFWRQTSQLLKPKLVRRNYEFACVSFEQVICENRVRDLQPSLASAVKSIPRWHFIQSSVPYILQCCAALLSNRDRLERLGNAERELLHTLHWILLEGPHTCCIVDNESLLYPLTIIEQFVHVLIPHVYSMQESDLTFRLENGMALWQPLWSHKKPGMVPFFTAVINKDTESEDDNANSPSSFQGYGKSFESDNSAEFSASTFFDVAVLKCLSSTGWAEDGVVWALRYLSAYLKKEFDLPNDEVISKDQPGDVTVPVPVHGQDTAVKDGTDLPTNVPLPGDVPVGGAIEGDISKQASTKSDGGKGLKRTNGDTSDLDSSKTTNLQLTVETTSGVDDNNANNGLNGCVPESTKTVQLLELPSSAIDGNNGKYPEKDSTHQPHPSSNEHENRDVGEGHENAHDVHEDGSRKTGSTLERSGSTRLRIRVQSSPVMSRVGRVFAAVATLPGNAAQYEGKNPSNENSQGVLSETATFYNTKIFIRPTATLQPSTGSRGDGSKESHDSPVSDVADAQRGVSSNSAETSLSTIEVRQKQGLDVRPVDSSNSVAANPVLGSTTMDKDISVENELNGADQPSLQDVNSSLEGLESLVSYGSERDSQIAAMEAGIPRDLKDLKKDTHANRLLSEQASSSLPSTSSIDSEKRTVEYPFKLKGRTTERYFVVPGAAEYITTDGRLSILGILQALHTIMHENPTPRICDASLTVLQHLVVVHERNQSKKRGSSVDVDDRTVAEAQAVGFRSPHSENVLGRLRASFYGKPPSFFSLAMVCLIRLVKALGCPLGCGEGCHGTDGDRLRDQASSLLSRLYNADKPAFNLWLQHYARLEPHEDLVDFLHALVGFCEDGQNTSDDEIDVAPPAEKQKSLFSMPEGINGVIIGGVFKTLLTRVAEMNFHDLTTLTFYGELRQLLRFVKDSYGGVFWKVALSGLLDSAFKESKEPSEGNKTPEQETFSRSAGKISTRDKTSSKVEKTVTYKKRKFLQKFARVTESSDSNLANNSGSFGSHRMMAVADSSSLELALSPRSKRKQIFTLGTWRKQKIAGTVYDSDDDLLDASESPSEHLTPSARRKLLKVKALSRKKLDEVFAVKIPAASRRGDGTPGSPAEPSTPIDIIVNEYETKPVDVGALRAGMVRLRFLLDGSQPGSVPDPKIVASMLDLEAPPVARASLLLECCLLVHKCNKGEWPQWLRGSLPSLAHRRGGITSPAANPFMFAQRRNLVAMHEAGVLFHAWGVALGQKIEQVLARRRRKMLPSIQEEGAKGSGKANMGEVMEVEEDFLDEASLRDTVKVCPYPLMMIACQLLQEITAFLRESHGLYSVSKPTPRPLQRPVAPRRHSVVNRRKSTMMASEAQQHRFSTFLGGGGEKIRKASIWSQTSLQTDMASSPSKGTHDPPVIKVSESDPTSNPLEVETEGNRVRRESVERTNRASLYFPRVSTQHMSPKIARSVKRTIVGGEGESVRSRAKSTKCYSQHLSVEGSGAEEDDESEEEDQHVKLPWLSSIIQLNSSTAFLCDHQGLCPINCHQRQSRSCTRMLRALKVVYSSAERQDKMDKWTVKGGVGIGSPLISAPQVGSVDQKSKKDDDDKDMLEYITSSIASLTQCPFSVIAKAGTVVDAEHLVETLPVAWELLLDEDQQLVSSVAAVFLLTGVRLRDTVEQMLHKELICTDANDRVKSLLRLEVLWQSRYHAWPRLQEGARLILKVPPPKVDFTLPSPAVGVALNSPPDCPWDARLTLEEQQGRKLRDKKKSRDTGGNDAKKEVERSEFLMRAVPVSLEATVGVHVAEDDKEKARADVWHYHLQGGNSEDAEEEDGAESQQIDAELWPQALSSAIPDVIRMMDDVMVDSNKLAVMEGARRLVWKCLIDDPVLFFRIILEQLTKKDKQEEHISLLRKLLLYITELPPTASRFLINNLIGVAMFYARTNKADTQDSLALILSLLWQLAPNVREFLFKDLKQCLRKEHCDNALRISSNVPGAKKLCVILPDEVNDAEEDEDQEKAKETVPVHDEMTFGKVLQSFKARLKVSGKGRELFLVDKKSDEILEEKYHVRDVFTYRKGFPSPLLLLEYLDPEQAFNKRQAQAFTSKISEIGRVLLTSSILKALPNQKHISFLHGEFSRQISFPRKALDCDFALYAGGTKGKELAALDVIHKSVWVTLITSLFEYMSTDFPWASADLHLFLNVINGAILLHCEDGAMLRLCLASFINIAVHFSHIFASNGYQYIFPSLLQVYSHQQSNEMVTTAIEFAMKQFYALHQKPCLLQLFASVAPILLAQSRSNGDEEEPELDDLAGKIPPKCLFSLLMSLDKPSPDSLEVLDLVRAEKPLKPVDSCYESSTDPPGESQIDTAVRLCVTVVNFAPESKRAVQMVVVLSAILPHYLESLKTESSSSENDETTKRELTALSSLATSINVLVKSSEVFTRSFVHFQSYKSFSDKSGIFPDLASTTSLMFGRASISSNEAPSLGDEGEWGRGRPFLERLRAQEEKDEILQALEGYRKPRDALLILVSDYVRICTPRLEELKEALVSRHAIPELLDSISINTLAQIVYSLLKLAVYDPVTLSSVGVKRYITDVFPLMTGAPEALETAMALVVKRVNKMFEKLVNKPDLMRGIDWKSLEVYLKGLHVTLCKRPFIADSPYLKNLVTICTSLVLQERAAAAVSVAANLPFAPMLSPPQFFTDTVIKLASRLMYVVRDQCSLKELCGGTINFGSASRSEKVFVRVILPICIRLGSGRTDAPKASPEDVTYALSCFLKIITTKNTGSPATSLLRLSLIEDDMEQIRSLSFGTPHASRTFAEDIPENLYCSAYLGIKVLMVCFEDHLATEWYRIYQAIETVVESQIGNVGFWDFMNFCVSYRTPLFLLMVPLIRTKVISIRHSSRTERALKQRVLDKLTRPPQVVNCRNALIGRFLNELAAIKLKRPAATIGEEDEVEEGARTIEEPKSLVLQPPPPGRDRSSSVPEGPTVAALTTDENKPMEKMTRVSSVKTKKSVTFSPAPSFDDDQVSIIIDPSSNDAHSAQDKRRKRLLRKQESFEAVEEHEGHHVNGLLDVDSGGDPFAHQRNATYRGKKVSTGRARRRFEKVRTVTSVLVAERKTRNRSVELQVDTETESTEIMESSGEILEMKVMESTATSTATSVVEVVSACRRDSHSEMSPPIAKPESVTISLSPYHSPLRRSPVNDADDQFPDILEAIKPVPPVKFTPQPDDKHDSASARNGSVVPESKLAADYDVERAQRLSRTRWWHKMYTNVDIMSSEEDITRAPSGELSETSDDTRESVV